MDSLAAGGAGTAVGRPEETVVVGEGVGGVGGAGGAGDGVTLGRGAVGAGMIEGAARVG